MTEKEPLKWDEKQKVAYCIPLWLRDEQIKIAIQRVKGRITAGTEARTEPIAIVCFGPSLNDTWEKLRDFKFIITCSGAHKFLVDRGIIPTYHVDVDPREHKVKLMGAPHKDVEYLMASTCHPKVWDHLEGFNVKLWHVFDSQEDAFRTLPRGEWALTGGSSAGLRAMTIARFLGFKKFHVFGMDGCFGKSGSHADNHPNSPPGARDCEYNGVTYRTTVSMLECAKQTWHELDQLQLEEVVFYGEGLVQNMWKDYKPKPPKGEVSIGVQKAETISSAYRDLNAQLHRDNLAYGVGGGKHAKVVLDLSKSLDTRSILDYGCGKGYLQKELPFPIWEYDPAIPGKDEPPRPADLVVCTDVLEHIEPDKLKYVLDDLRRVVRKVGYFVIHTGPAGKTLPDGRNTHLIQEGKDWWEQKLSEFFVVGKIIERLPELHVVVAPKTQARKAA